MRNYNCAFYTYNFFCWEICYITVYFTCYKCINDIFLIYKNISGEVQNYNALFHQTDCILVNHSLCTVKCRYMDCDIIALFIDFIYCCCVMDTSGKSPCRIYGNIWIISINFHSKMCCYIRNKNSDCSKSDHTKFLSGKFCSCKCFFLLLSNLCDISIFLEFLYPLNSTNDISGCKKHSCNHKFFYTIRICSRCIEYNNSFLCTFIKRNIIHSGSCTSDCFQVLSEFHLMHFCTADKNHVSFIRVFCIYIIFIQFIHTNGRNWIQAMIFKHLTDSPLQISS